MKPLRFVVMGLAVGIFCLGPAAPALAAPAKVVDTQPPVVSIVGKTGNLVLVNTNPLLVQATAKDEVGLAHVWFNTMTVAGFLTLNSKNGFFETAVNTGQLNCSVDMLFVFATDLNGNVGMDMALVQNNMC